MSGATLDGAGNLETGSNALIESKGLPRFYLLLHNVSKKQNVGMLLRSACAFGVREVLVAGSSKNVQFFGAQGTTKHVPIAYFDSLDAAVTYAREKHCRICGVEIKPEAMAVTGSPSPFEHKIPGTSGMNVAFVLGNEGVGMSEKQCSICDFFVFIPQYGDGTASLNVAVSAGIIFQQFAAWARYPERERNGEKFIVKTIPVKRGPETAEDFRRQEERRLKRLQKEAEEQ